MKKKTEAMTHEFIAGIFGWAWIIGIPVWIYFLVQWIRGVHPWWYFVIAIAATGLCKAMTREYKKESMKATYESTGKDFAQEWLDLPENDKKDAVIEAFKNTVIRYHPDADIDHWVSKYNEKGRIEDMVKSITEGYLETNVKKPFQAVCHSFVDNYFRSLAGLG